MQAETLPARKVTVFDESGTQLDMASRYARAPRGERAYAVGRRNTGKNMTLLAGITLEGMTAPFVVEGGVTTAVLEFYFCHVLLPTLNPGDVVILDNLSAHHAPRFSNLSTPTAAASCSYPLTHLISRPLKMLLPRSKAFCAVCVPKPSRPFSTRLFKPLTPSPPTTLSGISLMLDF